MYRPNSNKPAFFISKFRYNRNRIIGLSFYDCYYIKGWFYERGPRIVLYRDYSKFDKNNFRQALKDCLHWVNREDVGFSEFNDRIETALNVHAPIKKKYVRANDGPFMTKALRKAIHTRTNLRNRYNKNKSQENCNAFKKQRNRCVKILRQAKID